MSNITLQTGEDYPPVSHIWTPDSMKMREGGYFKSRPTKKSKYLFSGILFAGFISVDFIAPAAPLSH